MNLPPDEEGNEHQVWFLPEESRFVNVTWLDFFGLSVLYRQDEDSHASPIAYLERWHLHNELFGDNVEFVGVLMEGTKMRLVIQQPAIEGVPASVEHIHHFFAESGWTRFEVAGEVAFFDSERCVVIWDTHQGNLILMKDGLLAPIDLRVQPLSGALLDYVQRVCRKTSQPSRGGSEHCPLRGSAAAVLPNVVLSSLDRCDWWQARKVETSGSEKGLFRFQPVSGFTE